MGKRLFLYLFTLVMSSAVFTIFLGIRISIIMGNVANAVVSKDMLLLKSYLLDIAALIGFSAVTAPLLIFLCIKCIKKTIAEIRLQIYNHVVHLPISYLDSEHSGKILSIVTNDLNIMENAYFFPIFNLVCMVFLGVGSIITMFRLNYKIAFVLIGIGIFSTVINMLFAGPIKKASYRINESQGRLSQMLFDIISGYAVTKVFNLYEKQTGMVDKVVDEMTDDGMKITRVGSGVASINYLLNLISFIGLIIIAAVMSMEDAGSLGISVTCIRLQAGISAMFMGLGSTYSQLQVSLAGAQRVKELLMVPKEEINEDAPVGNSIEKDSGENAIVVKNISFSYNDVKKTLEDITLMIPRGMAAAIVGESGSGKSTILKLMLGLYRAGRGTIKVFGIDIYRHDLLQIRKNLGYVPQDTIIFNDTIRNNICLGYNVIDEEDLIEAAKCSEVHEFIGKMPNGYDTLVGEKGVQLSGGQKQRIGIARALIRKPEILLLDEITSALDAEMEKTISRMISNYINNGRSVIMVSHRLSIIRDFDKIFVLDNGKAVEAGSHEELINKNGKYKKLYELQNGK